MTPEDAGYTAQAGRGAFLTQRLPHFAQVDLRSCFVGLQDHSSMRLDPIRVPVDAHWLGRDLTLGPVPGVPTDRARLGDAEPLRCSSARGTCLEAAITRSRRSNDRARAMVLLRDPIAMESRQRVGRYSSRLSPKGNSSKRVGARPMDEPLNGRAGRELRKGLIFRPKTIAAVSL